MREGLRGASVIYSIKITRQGPWADKFTAEIFNREFRTISVYYICIQQKFCQLSRLNLCQLFANNVFFIIFYKNLGSRLSVLQERSALSFVVINTLTH